MKTLALIFSLALINQGLSSREKRFVGPSLFPVINNTETIVPTNNNNEISINCTFYNTSIWITYDFLETNVSIANIDSLSFLDENNEVIPNCTYNVDGEDLHIVLEQFGQCAQRIKNRGNETVVYYLICIFPAPPSPPIFYTRDMPTSIALSCPYVSAIYGELVIKPEIRKVALPSQEEPGSFDLKFLHCNDTTCSYPEPNAYMLVAGTTAVIGLEICDGQNLDLILQVISCWATSDKDPNSSPNYQFIENGCPYEDPMLPNSNQIHENFVSYEAIFSFVAFVWTRIPRSEQYVFLHCDVRFCPTIITNCSAEVPDCEENNLGRRSAGKGSETKRASFGPIEIKPCDKVELGCSHDCTISEDETPVCICPDGLVLSDDDLQTCEEPIDSPDVIDYSEISYEEEPAEQEISYEFIEDITYIFYGLIAGLFIAFAVVYWLFRSKKTNANKQHLPFTGQI